MRKPVATHEHFVEVWQSSNSASEAARRLKIAVSTASRRAWRLRQAGVQLKSFVPRIDAAGLNEICAQ